MKYKLLLPIAALVFVTCKKTKTETFEATDITGYMNLKGNLSKNCIINDGNGGWTNTGAVPAASINVSVRVSKNSLYPNSTAQGSDVYYGTSDANGNYNVSVRANGSGVNAQITVEGFFGSLDTLMNGLTRKGLNSTFAGTTLNRTLYAGQNSQFDFAFSASPVQTNPNAGLRTGTASITGVISISQIKESLAGTLTVLSSSNIPVADQKVYLNFSNDPTTQATRYLETTTDASGRYTFNINTVESGTSGFNQDAVLWIADYATSRDTIKLNNTIKKGKDGVFKGLNTTENGVYKGNIRNAINMSYNTFIAN